MAVVISRILTLCLLIRFTYETTPKSQIEIPMSMFNKMRNITTTREFVENMLQGRQDPNTNIPTGMDPYQTEMLLSTLAEEDGCSPHPKPVEVPASSDIFVIYYPTCVSVDRCAGCCSHEAYECKPTAMVEESYMLLRARYPYLGAERFVVEGMEEVKMVRHTACDCGCRVDEHHCIPGRQEYVASECKCRCLNERMAEFCTDAQIWNSQKCECSCENKETCCPGSTFNERTCSCQSSSVPTAASPYIFTDPCANFRCYPGYAARLVHMRCVCAIQHTYERYGPKGITARKRRNADIPDSP